MTPLLGWTFIAATVGLVINSLENSSDLFSKIISAFLSLSWTVISFLVLLILIIEGKRPNHITQVIHTNAKKILGRAVDRTF